jgi:hypothetical protein
MSKLMKKLMRERPIDKVVDWFEDLIEDTVFEKPYNYVYRKFTWGWWNPRTMYYKVKYGVQNLWRWFPLIWNDRDWDWRYWLEMNIKKLEGMEVSIRNGHHLYGWRDADNIHKAVLALKRLLDDDYGENAFRNHKKKYGKLNMTFGERDERGMSECIFSRPNANTEKEIKAERVATHRLYKHQGYMQKQDLEYATKIINKYLFHWWD